MIPWHMAMLTWALLFMILFGSRMRGLPLTQNVEKFMIGHEPQQAVLCVKNSILASPIINFLVCRNDTWDGFEALVKTSTSSYIRSNPPLQNLEDTEGVIVAHKFGYRLDVGSFYGSFCREIDVMVIAGNVRNGTEIIFEVAINDSSIKELEVKKTIVYADKCIHMDSSEADTTTYALNDSFETSSVTVIGHEPQQAVLCIENSILASPIIKFLVCQNNTWDGFEALVKTSTSSYIRSNPPLHNLEDTEGVIVAHNFGYRLGVGSFYGSFCRGIDVKVIAGKVRNGTKIIFKAVMSIKELEVEKTIVYADKCIRMDSSEADTTTYALNDSFGTSSATGIHSLEIFPFLLAIVLNMAFCHGICTC